MNNYQNQNLVFSIWDVLIYTCTLVISLDCALIQWKKVIFWRPFLTFKGSVRSEDSALYIPNALANAFENFVNIIRFIKTWIGVFPQIELLKVRRGLILVTLRQKWKWKRMIFFSAYSSGVLVEFEAAYSVQPLEVNPASPSDTNSVHYQRNKEENLQRKKSISFEK